MLLVLSLIESEEDKSKFERLYLAYREDDVLCGISHSAEYS